MGCHVRSSSRALANCHPRRSLPSRCCSGRTKSEENEASFGLTLKSGYRCYFATARFVLVGRRAAAVAVLACIAALALLTAGLTFWLPAVTPGFGWWRPREARPTDHVGVTRTLLIDEPCRGPSGGREVLEYSGSGAALQIDWPRVSQALERVWGHMREQLPIVTAADVATREPARHCVDPGQLPVPNNTATAWKLLDRIMQHEMLSFMSGLRSTSLDDACGVLAGQRCAVVGSAGQLLQRTYGAAIEAHDAVVRVNEAFTAGYEDHVGIRTDLRVLNTAGPRKGLLAMALGAVRKGASTWRVGVDRAPVFPPTHASIDSSASAPSSGVTRESKAASARSLQSLPPTSGGEGGGSVYVPEPRPPTPHEGPSSTLTACIHARCIQEWANAIVQTGVEHLAAAGSHTIVSQQHRCLQSDLLDAAADAVADPSKGSDNHHNDAWPVDDSLARRRFPTTGLAAILHAAQCCASVTLYGFSSAEYALDGVRSRYFDPASVLPMRQYHHHDLEAVVISWLMRAGRKVRSGTPITPPVRMCA